MIRNINYKPEKLGEHALNDAQQRAEDLERRKQSLHQIQIQRDPSYRVTPDEEIVDISEGEE